MQARLAQESRRLFHSRRSCRARRVPVRVVERLPALGPAQTAVVIARNVEEAAVAPMTPPVLPESRRSSTLLDRGASRTLARGNPVL